MNVHTEFANSLMATFRRHILLIRDFHSLKCNVRDDKYYPRHKSDNQVYSDLLFHGKHQLLGFTALEDNLAMKLARELRKSGLDYSKAEKESRAVYNNMTSVDDQDVRRNMAKDGFVLSNGQFLTRDDVSVLVRHNEDYVACRIKALKFSGLRHLDSIKDLQNILTKYK